MCLLHGFVIEKHTGNPRRFTNAALPVYQRAAANNLIAIVTLASRLNT